MNFNCFSRGLEYFVNHMSDIATGLNVAAYSVLAGLWHAVNTGHPGKCLEPESMVLTFDLCYRNT
jgi:hypothetical protein